MKSIRKYGIDQKLVFKTKGPNRVMGKATPYSYWIQCFLGYREIRKKGGIISREDGKYAIRHGTAKECRWGRHQICHHASTIGKQPSGKMSWSD